MCIYLAESIHSDLLGDCNSCAISFGKVQSSSVRTFILENQDLKLRNLIFNENLNKLIRKKLDPVNIPTAKESTPKKMTITDFMFLAQPRNDELNWYIATWILQPPRSIINNDGILDKVLTSGSHA